MDETGEIVVDDASRDLDGSVDLVDNLVVHCISHHSLLKYFTPCDTIQTSRQ